MRELRRAGETILSKVHTGSNVADMFTKVLDRIPFDKLRKLMMNLLVRSATMVMPRARRARAS